MDPFVLKRLAKGKHDLLKYTWHELKLIRFLVETSVFMALPSDLSSDALLSRYLHHMYEMRDLRILGAKVNSINS